MTDDEDLLPGFVPEEYYAPGDPEQPVCFRCHRTPEQIEMYVEMGKGYDPEISATEFVLREEGTLNPANGHFACDECYIAIGMPSSDRGWVAP